jgi:hypothetical protein
VGFGVSDVARAVQSRGATAILTTDYESSAWFAFYSPLPVVQLNDENRWIVAPRPAKNLFDGPLLYVATQKRDRHDLVTSRFRHVVPLGSADRMHDGMPIERYLIYRVSGLRGPPLGRMP